MEMHSIVQVSSWSTQSKILTNVDEFETEMKANTGSHSFGLLHAGNDGGRRAVGVSGGSLMGTHWHLSCALGAAVTRSHGSRLRKRVGE